MKLKTNANASVKDKQEIEGEKPNGNQMEIKI